MNHNSSSKDLIKYNSNFCSIFIAYCVALFLIPLPVFKDHLFFYCISIK